MTPEVRQLIFDLAEELSAVSHVCHMTNGVDDSMPNELRFLLRRVDDLFGLRDSADDPEQHRRINDRAKTLLLWIQAYRSGDPATADGAIALGLTIPVNCENAALMNALSDHLQVCFMSSDRAVRESAKAMDARVRRIR